MSSKPLEFSIDALEQHVEEYHTERIEEAKDELARLEANDIQKERAEWRATQEARISELFSRLGDDDRRISDFELKKWKIEEMPEISNYETSSARRRVYEVESALKRAHTKFLAMKRPESGTVFLTSAQLRDYFGIA